MPQLSLRSFNQMVRDSAAAAQGACANLLDLSLGSASLSILEAGVSLAVWYQWLIVLVLRTTRLTTSVAEDVDSFVGDFTLTRLPGVAATGQVTLSRFISLLSALIPPGALVITADGTQSFAVTADPTNPFWNVQLGGYLLPPGFDSLDVPVQALLPGTAGNVQAGTITLPGTAIEIDTVSNALAFSNGADTESDDALKVRFANYIGSLSKATLLAIAYAISQVQQGLSWYIDENQPRVGCFTVTVDDGTGDPAPELLSRIYTAIDQVRPIGSTFTVIGPTVTLVNITATITAATGFSKPTLYGPIIDAVESYLDTLPIGTDVSFARMIQVIFGAAAGIDNITNLLLNGTPNDIAIGPNGVAKAGSVVLT